MATFLYVCSTSEEEFQAIYESSSRDVGSVIVVVVVGFISISNIFYEKIISAAEHASSRELHRRFLSFVCCSERPPSV